MEVISNVEYRSTSSDEWSYESYPSTEDISECTQAVNDLACRLEEELKLARHQYFPRGSGGVLLPYGLLQRISRDILAQSESEPCGLRGCTLYLKFQPDDSTSAPTVDLNTVKLDRYTPSTFELYLTLSQATAGWNSFIPQFLKKYIRRGDVMIDSHYSLEKNKLYRSYSYSE